MKYLHRDAVELYLYRFKRKQVAEDKDVIIRKEDYGYPIYAVRQKPTKYNPEGFVVYSGCRWFTPTRARAHWGTNAAMTMKSYIGCDCVSCTSRFRQQIKRGKAMVVLIPKLVAQVKRRGWARKTTAKK